MADCALTEMTAPLQPRRLWYFLPLLAIQTTVMSSLACSLAGSVTLALAPPGAPLMELAVTVPAAAVLLASAWVEVQAAGGHWHWRALARCCLELRFMGSASRNVDPDMAHSWFIKSQIPKIRFNNPHIHTRKCQLDPISRK